MCEDAAREAEEIIAQTDVNSLAELTLLRRKARALDELAARALYTILHGGDKIVTITMGEKYRVIRRDGTWEDGCVSLMAAIEKAMEGEHADPR